MFPCIKINPKDLIHHGVSVSKNIGVHYPLYNFLVIPFIWCCIFFSRTEPFHSNELGVSFPSKGEKRQERIFFNKKRI